MTTEIKRYDKSEWFAVALDLDNGSSYVEFFVNGDKFAEIYCDDYDYGKSSAWLSLDSDIEELPGSYQEVVKELNSWENNGSSPFDKDYWTSFVN